MCKKILINYYFLFWNIKIIKVFLLEIKISKENIKYYKILYIIKLYNNYKNINNIMKYYIF